MNLRIRSRIGSVSSIPIRARIALFGGGVVAIAVIVFGLLVYALVQKSLLQQQDQNLIQRSNQFIRSVGFGPRGLRVVGSFFGQEDLSTSSDPFVVYADPAGTTQLSGAQIDGIPPSFPLATLKESASGGVPTSYTLVPDIPVRIYVQSLVLPDSTVVGYVVTGVPIRAVNMQLNTLRVYLVLAALLSLLGALIASWLLAGRALKPLVSMARTAEEIGYTQDLSRRLPQEPTDDEVGRLQRSFNRMLQQLDDAYRRLQGALAAQRRFVADASHELRTPLTTIRGNVGLLLKRNDITSEDRAAALQDIAGESERMSRMVQDLLTLARADAGHHLDKAPLDLLPIVRDVSRQAQTVAEHREVTLDESRDVRVVGNPDALKQLLWILVDNAVKHTDDGGHVRLSLEQQNGYATLSVRDDGTGIPQGESDRIFERFYQADTARSGDGAGLGLAIARWIVQEHNGRVFAVNNPDRGATFRVALPVEKS